MAKQLNEVLVSVKNMEVTFGSKRNKFVAVHGVSFDIYKGETFGLVGESGSGKTTIGRAIIRINPMSDGEVIYKGEKINGKISKELDKKVTQQIQMIFQDPMASLNERAKVDYIVSEGLLNVRHDLTKEQRAEMVSKALLEVGLLPEHLTRYPHEFSGGQRQRIGIARAIILNPSFLVCDEPVSALDVSVRAQVLNLMKRFQKEHGTAFLFIAHDLSVVRYVSDRIGVICKGRMVEIAEAEELFRHPLHPYTRSLLSAVPIPDPKLEREKVLITYDPSIHREEGELVDIGQGHWVYGSGEEIAAYKAHRATGQPYPEDLFQEPQPVEATPKEEKHPWNAWVLGTAAAVGAAAAIFGLCLLWAGM